VRAPNKQEAVEPSIIERADHPVSRRDIDPNVLKILYRLTNAGHIAYLVGGGVRDLMVGRRPKDFDIATSAHPQQVRALFRNSRMIGRRFRLVHVFFGPKNIEVATFRRLAEAAADVDDPMIRHDNTFGTPEEDAFRRDFTINSLFYDPRTFRVIDYAGGVPDLRSRLIRTIGDPPTRIREDPVRILRAVRFAAKMGFEIEPATRAAIETHRGDLAKASVPRLVEETFRTLGVGSGADALMLLEQLGLLDALLPAISDHLKSQTELAETPTVRTLAGLGEIIAKGNEPSRAFLLSCLYADVYLGPIRKGAPPHRFDLVDALRSRGFSRADTEHMRLLLEALPHMLRPSRLTRRLSKRPYFAEARELLELVAPIHGETTGRLDHFLAQTSTEQRPVSNAPASAGQGPHNGDKSAPAHRPRRRLRRRGGRRRHGRPTQTPALETI
jgi:poly(A) polymerase